MGERPRLSGMGWAIFFVRWVLGLIFGMAGFWKVFTLGPVGHAQRFFLSGFSDSWIPVWLLWTLGVTIPFVELIAGFLVCAGLWLRPALVALGGVLVLVSYGHLLQEPLYDTTHHIFPRLVLLVFVLVAPRGEDLLSLDHLRFLRRARRSATVAQP